MKRRVSHFGKLACILIALGILGGCGKPPTNPSSSMQNSGSEPSKSSETSLPSSNSDITVISVWSADQAAKPLRDELVEKFNAERGKDLGIQVENKAYGGDYANVLKIALQAGEGPDIFGITGSIQANTDAGWIIALEDLPGSEALLEKYQNYRIEGLTTYNEKMYLCPLDTCTCAVAYNKDLLAKNGFSEPPRTWSELREMAKTVTENGEGKEFGFIEGLKSTGYSKYNGLYHGVNSTGMTGFDPRTGKFNFSAFAPLFQTLVNMRDDGSWFPGVEGLNNDQARAQYAEGNIAFKLSASWDAAVLGNQFPMKADWGWCRPVMEGAPQYKYFSTVTASFAINSSCRDIPEKILPVYEMIHSDEFVVRTYENGTALPYDLKLLDQVSNPPTLKNWAEIADISDAYVYPPSPVEMLQPEGDTYVVTLGKILTLGLPVEEGLFDLDQRYNDALDKAVQGGFNLDPYINPDFDTSVK